MFKRTSDNISPEIDINLPSGCLGLEGLVSWFKPIIDDEKNLAEIAVF